MDKGKELWTLFGVVFKLPTFPSEGLESVKNLLCLQPIIKIWILTQTSHFFQTFIEGFRHQMNYFDLKKCGKNCLKCIKRFSLTISSLPRSLHNGKSGNYKRLESLFFNGLIFIYHYWYALFTIEDLIKILV